MSPRVDRALRVHPIVPCCVWYRQGMLEQPSGPAHDESASNRRTNMIPSAAVSRQSRIHFGMVRVRIPPGHLHPRPPTAMSHLWSKSATRFESANAGRILAVVSRRVAETLSQTCDSPTPTDPGPGNSWHHRARGIDSTQVKNGRPSASCACHCYPISDFRSQWSWFKSQHHCLSCRWSTEISNWQTMLQVYH
jgi:hypothetical protein